jgi:hypothetical protein
MIELDAQEQAMLNLLQLYQDAGTSLEFFNNLATSYVAMEGKALILGKPLSGTLFLTTFKRRSLTRFQSLTY